MKAEDRTVGDPGTRDRELLARLDALFPPGPVRIYVVATAAAWAVFHALPLLMVSLVPGAEFLPVGPYTALAVAALAALLAGIAIAPDPTPHDAGNGGTILDVLYPLTAKVIRWAAIPLTGAALVEAVRTFREGYGAVDPVSGPLNLALYGTLTLLPVILWNRDRIERRAYFIDLAAIVLPRLVVSLGGPRFFVLQALIPIAIWELACWRAINYRRVFLIGAAAFLGLFVVGPVLRGDAAIGLEHMALGSPIGLWAQFDALGLLQASPRHLVACEIAAGITHRDPCDLRGAFGVSGDVPARLDQVATHMLRDLTGMESIGTGGNPLIEASPMLEVDASVLWFLGVGVVCGATLRGLRSRPICCFVAPHVLAKGLFLWRGTLGEFFDRIPLVVLVYGLLGVFVAAARSKLWSSSP